MVGLETPWPDRRRCRSIANACCYKITHADLAYINAPVGLVSFLICYALLEDPDYQKQERAKQKKRPASFDGIGLALLALVMVSWEMMLYKGQEWDWLGDPFWRVQKLLLTRGRKGWVASTPGRRVRRSLSPFQP